MRDHLTDIEVSLILEQRLSLEQQSSVEQHLSHCQECCEHLAESSAMMTAVKISNVPQLNRKVLLKAERLVRATPRKGLMWNYGANKLQLAFAMFLLMFIGAAAYLQPWKSEETVNRSGETILSVELVSPVEGEIVSLVPMEFLWSDVPEAMQYQFYLMNETGEVITKHVTTEPKLNFRQTDLLEREKTYHWQVDAIMMEGSVVSSESASFLYLP
ncbi:MAG: hypothetical protein HYZ34_02575 [Ignavibacteriae bacterium]|nr:hypothetical protein [Ignavibacteriota bacterium]